MLDGSRRVLLGGTKQRALLVLLLLEEGRVVSRDRLIDALWGAGPPRTARHSLEVYVSELRKSLGEVGARELLVTEPPGYSLRADPETVDARRFEHLLARGKEALAAGAAQEAEWALVDALDLWRGEALVDFEFESFARSEIARLHDLRLEAVSARADALLALGRHGEAVAQLERAVHDHPLQERLRAQLMLALYRAGRQTDALDVFRATRHLLRELGLEPTPELHRLQYAILRHDPALAPDARRLRGYQLLERVGAGSFGEVHRSVQPHLGREVAIKVIRAELADDPHFVRRFEVEAQRVARLEHHRLVPLYDYWREPGAAYLVMRWMRGRSLHEALAAAPLPLERAVRLVQHVAAGLAAAHREGVVHGDMKPSNVLLDQDDEAYLSDFAIGAEPSAVDRRSTAYLAPERVHGEPPTPAADVYALGAILREAVAGSRPTDALIAVIERATAAEPRERYDDAARFSAALATAIGFERPAALPAVRNPYKGLRFFEEADAPDFFGREALVERLMHRLRAGCRLLALVGPSGSGKSSAARAGLIAALRDGRLRGSGDLYVAELFPGKDPLDELEAALHRVAIQPPTGLARQLRREPDGLVGAAELVLPPNGSGLVLLIDQLEEVFTHVQDEQRRAHFLSLLEVAATHGESRVRIIVTLRADFFDRPLRYPGFAEVLRDGVETVTPLSPRELERAISLPARRAGVQCEPGLVGEIVADVSGQPGALPLLQYALTELFDRRRADVLTLGAYAEIGRISGALARRAEELYERQDGPGREAVRQLLLRLVTLGEATEATRRRVTRAELLALELDERRLAEVLEVFGRHRLLAFDRDVETREPTVEIAHEALIGAWHRLHGWLQAAREDMLTRRRLLAAAREWEASQRDDGSLLRGSRLDMFETWAATTGLALGRTEREYLEASIRQRSNEITSERARRAREAALERRSIRRLRALVSVLGVAAALAGVLTVFALVQRGRADRAARVAAARELATAAGANLAADPERSILLALEAVEKTRSAHGFVLAEAEQALHDAVAASRVLVRAHGAGGSAAFDPDTERFASEGLDGAAGVWDARTGRRLFPLSRGVEAVDYAPDGRVVATAHRDGIATLWDAQARRKSLSVDGGGPLVAVRFGAGGDLLATAASGGQVRVWKARSGRRIAVLRAWTGEAPVPPKGDVLSFDSSGRRLAAAAVAPGRVAARVWDLRRRKPLTAIPLDGRFPPHDVDLRPDGRLLAIARWDGSVELRKVPGGELVLNHPVTTGDLWDVDFSADGRRLVTAAGDGFVKVWVPRAGVLRESMVLGGHAAVTNAGLSRDGTKLVSGGADGTARVWDITDEGPRAELTLPGTTGQFSGGVAFMPDGRRVAGTSRPDRVVRVWDVGTGRELVALRGHRDTVHAVAVSPDGNRIATASVDSTARLWDAGSGRQLWAVTVNDGCRALGALCPVTWAAFSPDGRLVAVSSADGTARILDASTGRQVRVLAGHAAEVFTVAFSPDGRRLGTASWDGTAKLWEVDSGRLTVTLDPRSEEVQDIAFSPAGDRVFTTGTDGRIRIWDPVDGRQLRSWAGDEGALFGLAVAPDGTRLATSGADGNIKLWDPSTGERLLTLPEGFELAFSPDGRRLASSSWARGPLRPIRHVHVWMLDPAGLIELARSRLTRALSDDECRQYLRVSRCEAAR